MKHLCMGLGVLLVMLLIGIFLCSMLNTRLDAAADSLSNALEAAWGNNFELAQEALAQTQEAWDRLYTMASSVLDHDDLESAELMLSRLTAAAKSGQWEEFTLQCQELLTLLRQIIRNELPVLENIL